MTDLHSNFYSPLKLFAIFFFCQQFVYCINQMFRSSVGLGIERTPILPLKRTEFYCAKAVCKSNSFESRYLVLDR